MNQIFFKSYMTPFGDLKLASYNDQLCLCDWVYRKLRSRIDRRLAYGLDAEFVESGTDVIRETIFQLEEYFIAKRQTFTIPLLMVGSPFQQSVWEKLITIPYGKTETYLGLSMQLGNPLAIRAVASANGANAISILIPCHRIVGSKGEMVGYAGGLATKKRLLNLEMGKEKSWELFDNNNS
ncbi:MAG: methylated-DNA--[protein]-cysteine S-methyltransferase [Bacteroidales bacterium]|nr:methylated-DNA--[protein]-cysteine S-methyltransferase [Bacteroidales bacterium]